MIGQITRAVFTWGRSNRKWMPLYIIGTVILATLLNLLVNEIPWLLGVAVGVFAAFLLLIVGALTAAVAIIDAMQEEIFEHPDVWVNTTPGPSAELIRDGSFVVPPEAMGSIYIGTPEPRHAAPEPSPEQRLLDDIFPEVGTNYPVLIDIHEEILAQLDQWGEQNHPDGTGGSTAKLNRTNAHKAVEAAVAANDGSLTWAMILREEFTEALAETDLEKIDHELTQIAAVCASWKQALAHRMAEAIGVEANPQ